MSIRTFKLTLAYDGAAYCGWQLQPNHETVQGAVERTLMELTQEEIRVTASGRTDSGVHALGQVISFQSNTTLGAAKLKQALNALLPEDITVRDSEEVANGFHAMHDTVRKRYRYVLDNSRGREVMGRQYRWFYPRELDVEAMQRSGQAIVGTHDFRCFESTGSPRITSVRTVYDLTVERGQGSKSNRVTIEVEANGFLYNMVRSIVGTLVEVGRGAESEGWLAEVIASQDRSVAGMTAPPQGLLLLWVRYE